MNNQDIQTKIDNYLLTQMTEAERQDFETEMATDNKLKESVELQRLLVTEIQQRAFISEIIVETEKRITTSPPTPLLEERGAVLIPPPAASKTISFRK